jgi:hypothetical protein
LPTSELLRARRELRAAHDDFVEERNAGVKSQRGSRLLLRISDGFVGYFARADSKAPEVLDAIGYRQSLEAGPKEPGFKAARRVLSRRITMRSPSEGVMFCRYVVHQGGAVAHEWAMEVWRKEDGRWKLLRIYEEKL